MRKKRSYKRWSLKDLLDFKKDYNSSMPIKDLCKKYKRTKACLYSMIRDHKFSRERSNRIKISDKDAIALYRKGETCTSIAKKVGCDTTSICNVLKRNSIKVRPNCYLTNKIYKINEHYFDKINSEDKAYILGFIYADGCISNFSNTVIISLEEHDKEILQTINKKIGSDNPLKYIKAQNRNNRNNKPQYALLVHNKYICSKLKEYGCHPRKSLNLIYPNVIINKFHKHFIRGYFDGDGCISYGKIGGDMQVSIMGTKEFLNSINNILKENVGVNILKLYRKKKCKKNVYCIRFCGNNQVQKIMFWLYNKSTIYLNRKYVKYKNLLSVIDLKKKISTSYMGAKLL